MYSVVLLAALTTGGDALPAHHGGCCGYGGGGGCCGYSSYCGCCGYSSCCYSSCCYSSCCYSSCCYTPCCYTPCCYSSCCYSGYGSTGSYASTGVVAQAPTASPATIVISLPADAKLTIDDVATTSTSGKRVFQSPSLPLGQDFHYTLTAEVNVDGKPLVYSQRVTIRGGQETNVSLTPPTGVASR